MNNRLMILLASWSGVATVLALLQTKRSKRARQRMRIALRMAADAVEARVTMERNTPVMVLVGTDGHATATAPMSRVRYWLN